MILQPVLPIYVLVFVALAFIAYTVFMLTSKKQRNIPIRRIAMLVLMFAILLRPMVRGGVTVQQESSLNIFFALDLTNSMVVADCKDGTYRFEKARQDIKDIAKSFPGARYSVIAADYANHIAMPLTDNLDALLSYAETAMPTDSKFGNGSNLGESVTYSVKHVEKYRESYPERKNILFLMSDGETTSNAKPSVTTNQLNSFSAVRVYGYGSIGGGYMDKILSGKIDNYRANTHISKINEKELQEYAEILKGSYENMSESDVSEDKMKELMGAVEMNDSGTIESYRDIYWVLALILAGFLLWEFSDIANKVLEERKVVKK